MQFSCLRRARAGSATRMRGSTRHEICANGTIRRGARRACGRQLGTRFAPTARYGGERDAHARVNPARDSRQRHDTKESATCMRRSNRPRFAPATRYEGERDARVALTCIRTRSSRRYQARKHNMHTALNPRSSPIMAAMSSSKARRACGVNLALRQPTRGFYALRQPAGQAAQRRSPGKMARRARNQRRTASLAGRRFVLQKAWRSGGFPMSRL